MGRTRILITGTGRTGSSFLMQLLTNVGVSTGFPKYSSLSPVYNAGMEGSIDDDVLVVKNPDYCFKIPNLAEKFDIPLVLIPIRELKHTARSRVKNGSGNGGFWKARNYGEQVFRHTQALYQLVFDCNKLNIPFVFIDFKQMMTDKDYLFNKLQPLQEWSEFNYDLFCDEYDNLIDLSKINFW